MSQNTMMRFIILATFIASIGASSFTSTELNEINATIPEKYKTTAVSVGTIGLDQANETALIPTLPNCFSLTMSVAQIFQLNYAQRQEFANSSIENPNGQSLTTCYPLVETLKKCQNRVVLDSNSYVYFSDNGTLTDSTGRDYYLGEYFMVPAADRDKFLTQREQDQLQGNDDYCAITCNITQKRPKRFCNYIELSPDKYKSIPSHHNTLYLPWRQQTLPFAEYETIPDKNGSINLCYPLTKAFMACFKWLLQKHEVTKKDGYQIYSDTHSILYDIGEYFVMDKNAFAVCYNQTTGPPLFDYYRVHAVLYSISAVCLLVAFIIHILVPSINYHAKPLLCHIFSLMAMYIGLTARKFTPELSTPTCYTLFIMMHYFALCAFFWLNVLAFDLWRIFADLKNRIGSVPCITCNLMSCNNTRFYSYCAYAWGIPMLITAAAIFLDRVPEAQDALHMPINIANMCWLENMFTSFILFYGPIAVILVENTIFFSLTVCNLRQVSRGTEFVNKKLNKQLFIVCAKLFVVMGLSWLIEVISWALGSDRNTWYIPDLVNATQGIVIFIIYICKPTTLKLLRNKLIRSPGGQWTLDLTGSKTQHDHRTSTSNISMDNVKSTGEKSLKSPNTTTTNFVYPHKTKK